jgi:hypothetical protein
LINPTVSAAWQSGPIDKLFYVSKPALERAIASALRRAARTDTYQ